MKPSGEYIFKDTPEGLKFIGDFDGLYLNDEDPWGQIRNGIYKNRRLLLLNTLLGLNPISVLDVGCGLGHATQLIQTLVTHNVLGIDISSVAVEKASRLFPDVDFKVMDVRKEFPDDTYDAIILNNILWYILEDFEDVLMKARDRLAHGGHLIIPQAFITDQKYGCDIIYGYDGLINFLSEYAMDDYTLTYTKHIQSNIRKTDSITVLQKRG